MLEFIGRLHPLILHLPIGILTFAFLLEAFMFFRKEDFKKVQSLVLLVNAITATLSIITGLLLIRGGDYSSSLVDNHKYVALGLGTVSWLLFLLYSLPKKNLYYFLLVSSGVLLGVTGHLGGSITHGEDFLTKGDGIQLTASLEEAVLYEDIIHPIVERKCVSCHNPGKMKGELNMEDYEGLIAGGENGEVILSKNPLESPMIERIHLPMDSKKHMPPKSKKQLSDDEINLIEWWLNSGADPDRLVNETNGYEEYASLAKRFLAPPEVDIFEKIEGPDSSKIASLKKRDFKIYPIHSGSSAVYVNLSKQADLSGHDLDQLRSIRKNIYQLNLAGSGFGDEHVSKLKRFKHLTKLELQNTSVTSKGIANLPQLDFLQTLNLYGTKVDSTIIERILSLPQLSTLYVWETELKEKDIEKIRKARPRLNVIYEINRDIFGDAALMAPIISAESDLFADSLEVSLDLNFRDVAIRYVINDSDTMLYDGPFKIGETSTVKAIASKAGWKSSEPNQRTFIRQGAKIKRVALDNLPHVRYRDIAKKAFNNSKLGSELFSDGEWVGYRYDHANLTAELETPQEIESVSIGFLESTGSYIFFPKGVEISISENGKSFRKIIEEHYDIADGPSNVGRRGFTYSFEKQPVRFIKIKVESHMTNPEWHPAPGDKCWIFIDEITIN